MAKTNNEPIVVMKRYEMKYLLNGEQTALLRERLKGHMEVDQYGKTSIASLYYDTPTYRLIRTSLEKPEFKEKIRLRSYGLATESSPVFLELKRKLSRIKMDIIYSFFCFQFYLNISFFLIRNYQLISYFIVIINCRIQTIDCIYYNNINTMRVLIIKNVSFARRCWYLFF